MVREEETVEELICTAQIVPSADRGQDLPSHTPTIEDIIIQLVEKSKRVPFQSRVELQSTSLEEAVPEGVVPEETSERVFKLRSSAMFPINSPNAYTEQGKLEFILLALQAES